MFSYYKKPLNSRGFYYVHLVTSVWTVDFEIPNFFAVSRTVALVCIIKFATSTALSSIYVFKPSTPSVSLGYVYAKVGRNMKTYKKPTEMSAFFLLI